MEPMTPEAAEAIRADFARRHNLPEDVRGHPNRAPNRVRSIARTPDRRKALTSVTTPTLIIHGTADPITPYSHGVASAQTIPTATMYAVQGMGHGPEPENYTEVADAILAHTNFSRVADSE
jgi:pimeloyl-ACP methyl ester carboxylesterase